MARESVTQAVAARRLALAAWLPNVDISASYIRRAREARPDGAPLLLNDALAGLLLVQSRVFDASQIANLSAAGARTDREWAAAVEAVRAFGFEVAGVFFLVLAAEGTAEAARQRVQRAEQVELETATARLALTEAENAERQARLALSFLLTRPVAEPLISGGPLVVGDAPLSDLFSQALDARPDLEALRREVVAQKQDALEPWLRLVPFIDATGRFTLTNETGFVGEALNWNLTLTATWNIYDGGARYADAQTKRRCCGWPGWSWSV